MDGSRVANAQAFCAALASATAALLLITVIPGCATTGPGPGFSDAPGTHTQAGDLDTARQDIAERRYSTAIHRLTQVLIRDPEAAPAAQARFLLGQAHYESGDYRDAERWFREYLDQTPEGTHVARAEEYLRGIESQTTSRLVSQTELEKQRAAAARHLAENPDVPAAYLALAESYWRSGDYGVATGVYRQLVDRWPDYADREPLRTRLAKGEDGQYYPVTPAVVTERIREQEPLVLHTINTYTSGVGDRRNRTLDDDSYHVTGMATNRGSRTLIGVAVEINLYGAVGNLFDTQTYTLGTMRPGESRPFVAHFTNFSSIHNVARHEISGRFERAE